MVNTLNNEGEMDQMLRSQTDLDFTSVLVPTLTWDPMTNKGKDFKITTLFKVPRNDVQIFRRFLLLIVPALSRMVPD